MMKKLFPDSHGQLLMNWLITETLKFVCFAALFDDETLVATGSTCMC